MTKKDSPQYDIFFEGENLTNNLNNNNDKDIDSLEIEIIEKIVEMESPSYEFPKRFGKKEYIAVAVVAAICLALILWGATF